MNLDELSSEDKRSWAAAEQLAREVVSIATNSDYGELRDDMIGSLLMRKVYAPVSPQADKTLIATRCIAFLAQVLEQFSDAIAKDAALLDKAHREVEAAERILRRPTDVDQDLRDLDG